MAGNAWKQWDDNCVVTGNMKRKIKFKTPTQACRTFANLQVRLQWRMEYICSMSAVCQKLLNHLYKYVPIFCQGNVQSFSSHISKNNCKYQFHVWGCNYSCIIVSNIFVMSTRLTCFVIYTKKTPSIVCILTLHRCFTPRPRELLKNASMIY